VIRFWPESFLRCEPNISPLAYIRGRGGGRGYHRKAFYEGDLGAYIREGFGIL